MMAAIAILKSLAKRRAETESAITGALAQIRDARALIDSKSVELNETHDLPVPPEDAKASMARWLDSIEAKAMDCGCFSTGSAHTWPDNNSLAAVLVPLIIEALRGPLEAKLSDRIDDFYELRDFATPQERAARIAALEAEIAALGRAEEALIRSIESSGLAIARRGAADPAIVILPDESLAA